MAALGRTVNDTPVQCRTCRSGGEPQRRRDGAGCIRCTVLQGRTGLKAEVMTAYGGQCACCGESRLVFLSLDHINNDGKADRAKYRETKTSQFGGHVFYRHLRDLGFPPGLQVLCANCHTAKTHYGQCPHAAENALMKVVSIA